MTDEPSSLSKDHHIRNWVALLSSVIGAAAFIIAAIITVDAKHDRDAAASEIAAKEAQINDLKQKLNVAPPGGVDSRDLMNQITSLRSALAAKDNEIQKLNEEIQKLRPNPPINPGNSVTQEESAHTTVAVQEEGGIRFELQGCRQSGSEVTCDLLITNQQSDRSIFIQYAGRSGSRIIDAKGNESPLKLATLGANRSDNRFASATLSQGISVRGSVTFGSAPPASTLKLLELFFRIGREEHRAQFHDIKLG